MISTRASKAECKISSSSIFRSSKIPNIILSFLSYESKWYFELGANIAIDFAAI